MALAILSSIDYPFHQSLSSFLDNFICLATNNLRILFEPSSRGRQIVNKI